MQKKMLTTSEAADRLGVTPARVRALVLAERLPAEKFGRDLMIKEADLALVQDRTPGRPSTKKLESAKKSRTRKTSRKT